MSAPSGQGDWNDRNDRNHLSDLDDTVGTAPFSLGVDGGGSKTRAVVVDAQGVERGSALAGCANAHRVGVERAIAEIVAATQQAAQAAGARLPFAAAWLGLAGLDSPADHATLAPILAALTSAPQRLRLTNDAELLLSALPSQVGVALIAGTGSIAVGRNAVGEAVRVGGWGHALGDEGSGYALGGAALAAAVRYADGRGEATALLERILAHWGLRTASDLIGKVYSGANVGDLALVAQAAPVVFEAARAGDAVAQRIVQRGAEELAHAALIVGERLGFGAEAARPLPLALGGSLLLRVGEYRAATLQAISQRRMLGEVTLVEQPALSAARAALSLATEASAGRQLVAELTEKE